MILYSACHRGGVHHKNAGAFFVGCRSGVCRAKSFPQRLVELWKSGLVDYVAMDIKNSPARYAETVGVPGLDLSPIRESVSWLLEGRVDYEFRTTVVRQFHDAQSFAQIGPWIAGAKRYYLQTFTHRDTVLRPGLSAWDGETMEGFAAQMRPYVSHVEVR